MAVDRVARERISVLEAQALQRDREIADLSSRLQRLARDFTRLAPLRPDDPIPKPAPVPAVPAGFTSRIVPDFPPLFADFRANRFKLLWRGTRDGFSAGEFHGRCDGHANTLTIICDTSGNIFGGFTPVSWESREWNAEGGAADNCRKADPTLKSFLFTLKNPHDYPPKKFPLKPGEKDRAIGCDDSCGPRFNDICVYGDCDRMAGSAADDFGAAYTNDTGLSGGTFFTGSGNFQVQEIEVFEVLG
jgi:hypothetical protein